MKARILFVLFFSTIVSINAAAQSPAGTVTAFYQYDRSHSQIFNRRNIDARKQWFSSELYDLFLYELKRENAYLKKNPNDKPYFGDGLPFQPIGETCLPRGKGPGRKLSVKSADQNGDRAAVLVTFAFPKPCKDPDPVAFTIGLVRKKSGWVIDDINFGEDRTLKEDLKRKDY